MPHNENVSHKKSRQERFKVARERIEISRHEAEELFAEIHSYLSYPEHYSRSELRKACDTKSELRNFIKLCEKAQDMEIEFPGVG